LGPIPISKGLNSFLLPFLKTLLPFFKANLSHYLGRAFSPREISKSPLKGPVETPKRLKVELPSKGFPTLAEFGP